MTRQKKLSRKPFEGLGRPNGSEPVDRALTQRTYGPVASQALG